MKLHSHKNSVKKLNLEKRKPNLLILLFYITNKMNYFYTFKTKKNGKIGVKRKINRFFHFQKFPKWKSSEGCRRTFRCKSVKTPLGIYVNLRFQTSKSKSQ
jgi:hypothetical protein